MPDTETSRSSTLKVLFTAGSSADRSAFFVGLLALAVATAGLALMASPAAAGHSGSPIVVDDDGDGQFTSLQQAIDHADAGDTLVVRAGTYHEPIVIDTDGLTLCSTTESADTCNPDPANALISSFARGTTAVDVDASDVTLEGFTVHSPSTSGTGVDASGADNLQLSTNDVRVGVEGDAAFALQSVSAAAQGDDQAAEYWRSPFVVDTFQSGVLEDIAEEREEDDGLLGIQPRTDPVDHVALYYEGQAPLDAEQMAEDSTDPEIRVYEDQGPAEKLPTLGDLALDEDREVYTAEEASHLEPPAPPEGVRPGTRITGNGCSANWVWETTDPSTGEIQYWLGTAGHCVPGISGQGTWEKSTTTVEACFQNCDRFNTAGTQKFVELGVNYGIDNGVGEDFAIMKIPSDIFHLVNTSLPTWGGPTGATNGQPAAGTPSVQYGHGQGTGDTYLTQARAGAFAPAPVSDPLIGYEGEVHWIGTTAPGDSGSAVATGQADTDHALVGDEAAGIVTHLCLAHTPSINCGTSIPKAKALVQNQLGLDLRVVTASESLLAGPDAPLKAPTNVEASDVSTTTTVRVELTWEQPVSSAPADSYRVYRDGTQIANVTETSYLDDAGLTSGTQYCYVIEAWAQDKDTSPSSAEVCITPELSEAPPPSFAVATDRGTGDEVSVIWGQPDGASAEGYHVERLRNGQLEESWTTAADNRSLVDSGLVTGATYNYSIQAIIDGSTGDTANATVTPTQDASVWRQAGGSASNQGFTGAVGDIQTPSVLTTANAGGPVDSSAKVGDIDDDGDNEIVVATDQGAENASANVEFVAYEFGVDGLEEKWRHTAPVSVTITTGFGQTAIADLDGDGSQEVAAFSHYDSEGFYLTTLWALDGETGQVIDSVSTEEFNPGHDAPLRVVDLGLGSEHVLVFDDNIFINTHDTRVLSFHLEAGSLVKDFQNTIGAESPQGGPALVENGTGGPPSLVASLGSRPIPGATQGDDVLYECDFVTSPSLNVTCGQVAGITSFTYGLSTGYIEETQTPSVAIQGGNGLSVANLETGSVTSTAHPEEAWNRPALAGLNGTGTLDITSASYNQFVNDFDELGHVYAHAFDGDDFNQLGLTERDSATGSSDQVPGGPVIADIDGDGGLDAIVGDESGTIAAISLDATTGDTSPAILWETTIASEIQAQLSLADVTGDGALEVVAVASDGSLAVIDATSDAGQRVGVDLSGSSAASITTSDVRALDGAGSSFPVLARSSAPNASVTDNAISATAGSLSPTDAATAVRLAAGSANATVANNDIQVPAAWCDVETAACTSPISIGVQTGAPITVDANTIQADLVDGDQLRLAGTLGVLTQGNATTVIDNDISQIGVGVMARGPNATVDANTISEAVTGIQITRDGLHADGNTISQTEAAVFVAGASNFAPTDVQLRENDLAANNVSLKLEPDKAGAVVDARVNDWGVHEPELVDARIDNADGNTVLTVPFQLADGSPEPGLVRIAGEAPQYLAVQGALDAAEDGDTVLVPASIDPLTPTAWNESLALATPNVTVCGSVGGTPACTSQIEAGHQQLSRANWTDAPGLGSGEAALFDAKDTPNDHRSTSYFPPEDAKIEDVDAFAFDYYLETGTCSQVDVYGQLAIDQTPDDGTHDRDELVYARPSLADCEQGTWFHTDLMDAEWSYAGVTGTYQDVVDKIDENYPDGDYEISAVNVAQTDEETIGYLDNQVIGDVVLGERQDTACGLTADTACRQETARNRTVLDANGASSQTVTLSAPGTSLADLTVKNTDRPSDDTGTVLITADDTTLTRTRVVGNLLEGDGTFWGDQIGVEIDGASGYRIADNTIENWSNMGIFLHGSATGSGAIADNTIRENTNHAIYLGGAAPDTTIEILDNTIGVHDDSALRLASFDRDHVIRGNDLSGAKNNPVRVTDDHNDRTLDLRGNYWGVVRESTIRERINDAGDHRILVVPYLDADGNQHPPRPSVRCFVDGSLTEVATPLSFQQAANLDLPTRCQDRDGNGQVHRTIVLGADEEAYNGATITSETTVLGDDPAKTRTQTNGVIPGAARIEANNHQPALEIRGDVADSRIQAVNVQGEPVGATGVLVEDVPAGADLTLENVAVGSRDHPASNGMVVRSSSDVSVLSSSLIGGDAVIELSGTTDTTIEDTRILMRGPEGSAARGIQAVDASQTTLADNTLLGNAGDASVGIELVRSDQPTVTGNIVADTAVGILAEATTSGTFDENRILVPPIDVFGQPTYGVSLVDGSGHQVDRNTFQHNGIGLRIQGTTDVSANLDRFNATTTGVYVTGLAESQSDAGDEIGLHNATLASTLTPLELTDTTAHLTVDARCNDWGVYHHDLVRERITDDGDSNEIDSDPFTSPDKDDKDVSCLAPPKTDFSYSPKTVDRLTDVEFTDESEDGTYEIEAYEWDFDDGTTASGPTATHNFDARGEFFVELTASDQVNMSSSKVRRVLVENIEPELDFIPDQQEVHTSDVDFTATASDAENDALTLDATLVGSGTLADIGASFTDNGDGTGSFHWNPASDQAGTYRVNVTVDDGWDEVYQTLDITVINNPPEFPNLPGVVGGAEERQLTLDVDPTDPDSGDSIDSLTANISELPDNATFTSDGSSGTLNWTPGLGEAGTYDVSFTATSPSRSTTETTTLEIREQNAPPTLSLLSSNSPVEDGHVGRIEVAADDPENDPIDWQASTDPPVDFELIDNGDTATWKWQVPSGHVGPVNVTFFANDGFSTVSTTETFHVDTSPFVGPLSPTELKSGVQTDSPIVGAQVQLSFRAYDPDANTSEQLDASDVTVYPHGFDQPGVTPESIGASIFVVNATYDTVGTHTIGYEATDTDNLTTQATQEIEVQTNDQPTVTLADEEILVQTESTEGAQVELSASASDPEERGLTEDDFVWSLPDTVSEQDLVGRQVSATLPVGTHEVDLTVTDLFGASTTETVTVEVDDAITTDAVLDAPKEGDHYRVSPTEEFGEELEGTVTVLDDLDVGVENARITGVVTYYGTDQDSNGVTTATFSDYTGPDGTYEFSYEQELIGAAPTALKVSLLSAPGWHEIEIDITADSRPAAPVDDLETGQETIRYFVGTEVPPEGEAGAHAGAACYDGPASDENRNGSSDRAGAWVKTNGSARTATPSPDNTTAGANTFVEQGGDCERGYGQATVSALQHAVQACYDGELHIRTDIGCPNEHDGLSLPASAPAEAAPLGDLSLQLGGDGDCSAEEDGTVAQAGQLLACPAPLFDASLPVASE